MAKEDGNGVTVGRWAELTRPASLLDLEAEINPEFLRRGDRLRIAAGQETKKELVFTGGVINAGREQPEQARYCCWLAGNGNLALPEGKRQSEWLGASEAVITAVWLEEGRVIINFPLAGPARLVRNRGAVELLLFDPGTGQTLPLEAGEIDGGAKVVWKDP